MAAPRLQWHFQRQTFDARTWCVLFFTQILTIPVKALIAVGTLSSSPKHIVLPPTFPVRKYQNLFTGHVIVWYRYIQSWHPSSILQGKVVHQGFSIQSSFTQKVRLQQIRSLTEDIRFYYKRLRNNKDELEPRRKSKVGCFLTSQETSFLPADMNWFELISISFFFPQVANIYFDASLQCGDHCYVGLPFVLKCKEMFFCFSLLHIDFSEEVAHFFFFSKS